MGTTGRVSINQWLANVSPADLGGDNACDGDHRDAFASKEGPQLSLLPLETPNNAQRPQPNKRHRDEPSGGSDPPHQSDKLKKMESYDRNPRRKTREARYTYQTVEMTARRLHGAKNPKETKTLRRTIKQTLNAEFHAPNVARDRLTLQPLTMVGLFSKGKVSSPIQLCQDQYRDTSNEHTSMKPTGCSSKLLGLAFSETTLSFDKKQISPKWSTSQRIVLGPLKMDHHPRGDRLVDCSDDRLSPRTATNVLNSESIKSTNVHNENPAMNEKLRESQESCNQKLILLAATPQGNCARQWGLKANHQNCLPESRSATPYTWSESEPYQPQLDRSIEDTLLAVLHVDLQAEISESRKAADMNRRYYKLKDLQGILETRKELWEEGASGGYPATCLPSHSISRPNHAASISKSGWNGSFHARKMIEKYPVDSDHIFQQLDVLFEEIVSSQDGGPAPGKEQLVMPPPRPGPPHSLKADFGTFSSNNPEKTRCYRHDIAPCDGIGLDNDTSASLRETLPAFRAAMSLRPSSTCSKNDYPTLLPTHSTDHQLLSQRQPFTENTSRLGHPMRQSTPEYDTLPLGFWRQNKLY